VGSVVEGNAFAREGVTATQSSTANNGVAKRAIDGNTSGIYAMNSCIQTED